MVSVIDLQQGNCLDLMKSLEDKSVDLIYVIYLMGRQETSGIA